MFGWILAIILLIVLLGTVYFTGVAFQNISKGMYDLCKKAGESPEPILKKYGLWTWYKND